jgi:Na+/melibiose symporter-like transporter
MVDYDKPLSLSLLAYMLLCVAFVLISTAVYVLFYGGKFWNDGILQVIESDAQQVLVIIIFSVFIMIASAGILKSSSGGRGLLIALCGITAIHGIVVMLSDFPRGFVFLVIAIVIIAYLFTYGVSSVFRPMDSRKAVDAIDALESYRRTRHFK